ncbi:hypothetical protein I302_100661 [Kwoniella bestiolae CBS 10118]|uniref:Protein kinase domain-containing protein n=1 Tax=Kwoniella bestiolae CBS 10118 TaxID=1296100 RepID=A0A1B9G5R4_9TREE|nr:hypothetical protein I302_04036 [Kwoniella bestiolae CBS 10118]OCF26353.1 hypothetical protein I302_04036 [Kwoniella bestiolae CBS 10118]
MFRINCTEQVAKGGRSELTHGLQFFRHPDSSFQIVQQTPTLATPALTHSPKPSARSTSLNTPSGLLKGDTASSPVQAHQLTRRLSQFQLGSVAGSQHSTGSSTPARKTYLDNILQPVHELDTSSIPGELIANLPKESSVIESISQESPFQPFEIPESFSGFSPAIMPVIQASPLATVHTVTISKFIGPGYLWDLWLGEHSQLGPVVLKLVYLPNYPCNRPEYEDYIPASDIIKEALKEESFYLGPLAIAQGEVVPRYHGLYHTSPGSNHIGMLLEYAGHALAPGIALLDEEWKNKVYSAYAKLHLHGVLHHDVSTQHILIDDRQRVRFWLSSIVLLLSSGESHKVHRGDTSRGERSRTRLGGLAEEKVERNGPWSELYI